MDDDLALPILRPGVGATAPGVPSGRGICRPRGVLRVRRFRLLRTDERFLHPRHAAAGVSSLFQRRKGEHVTLCPKNCEVPFFLVYYLSPRC